MNFQQIKKEARRISTIFTLAAGVTAGGVIGGGVLYHEFREPAAKVETAGADTNRIRIPASNKTVIEAEVVATANGQVIVRAHPWLGQFVYASVRPRGTPGAALTADITDASGAVIAQPAKGQKVWLRNLEGAGLSGMAADIPNIKAGSDKIEGPVQAHAVRVIDGDTPEVVAQIWPGFYAIIGIRIQKIDTPEKGGRAANAYERELGAKATAATRALIEGKDVLLYNLSYDKFGGRMLADVKTPDGVDAAQNLTGKGLARAYDGGKKEPWTPPPDYKAPKAQRPQR